LIAANPKEKMPLVKLKTIEEGSAALVRNHLGEARLVNGPARLTLWRSKVEMLQVHYAGEGQYLEVNQRAGPRLCLPGPKQLHMDPTKHASIHVKDAILVNANEALVIYGNSEKGGSQEEKLKPIVEGGFERRVLYGPTRYVPKPDEWIHEFSWHGTDPHNKTAKVKDMLKFKLLRIIADQFYYNVREVRTKDDTTITVKLMIFFELVDVVKMLDRTHDPIADFINAVASDTVQHCSGLTYEQFVENTSQMNELATFGSLCSRAETIGYKINKVVFRGFHSSDALQAMHDKAIQERTRLKLEGDTEEHRQRTLDMRLGKEEERSARQRDLEKEAEEHKRLMAREAHTEQLRLEAERAEQRRLGEAADHEARLVRQKAEAEQRVREESELGQMKAKVESERVVCLSEVGVNVTEVLVAECRNPDRTIKVEGSGLGGLHLYEHAQTQQGQTAL